MSPQEWLLLAMVLALFGAILSGIPAFLAIAGVPMVTAFAAAQFGLFNPNLPNLFPARVWGVMNNTLLMAVPLFVLMGVLLERARLAENMLRVLARMLGGSPTGMALAVLAFFGNTLTLFICLMGFYGWERAARIARGLTIAANEQGYAAAVRDIGASPLRVYGVHVLPNIASTLIVSVTLTFPEVILLESGLSFLGLGVQPPMTSLGNMVGYGREYLQSAPWILLAPSAVIVLTTFSISMVGDWLRDRLDPTLR